MSRSIIQIREPDDGLQVRFSFRFVASLTVGLFVLLCLEGFDRARLEKRDKIHTKTIEILLSRNLRLEGIINDCVDEKSMRYQFTARDWADITCKRIKTNVWQEPKKPVKGYRLVTSK